MSAMQCTVPFERDYLHRWVLLVQVGSTCTGCILPAQVASFQQMVKEVKLLHGDHCMETTVRASQLSKNASTLVSKYLICL